MGGIGSGRREYADRFTVEESTTLCVNNFVEFSKHPDAEATLRWGDGDSENQIFVSAEGTAGLDGADRVGRIRLKYETQNEQTGEVLDEHDYTILFDYTGCHLGGVRPWFNCPRCRDRVAKLYMPPTSFRFKCRECHDLAYYSTRVSGNPMDEARVRYKRAFSKADKENRTPHPENYPYFPERPKGMHHDTFDELRQEVEEARDAWDDAMNAKLMRLRREASPLT